MLMGSEIDSQIYTPNSNWAKIKPGIDIEY